MAREGEEGAPKAASVAREDILKIVDERGAIENTRVLANELNWDHEQLVGAMKSLQARGMIAVETHSVSAWVPSQEGQRVLSDGSPEFRVFQLAAEPISQKDVEVFLSSFLLPPFLPFSRLSDASLAPQRPHSRRTPRSESTTA